MTLLSIVQQAFGEIGLNPPAQVVGSGDLNVTKALALATRAGAELHGETQAADYWPALRRQFLFNLAGAGPFTALWTYNSKLVTITGTAAQIAAVAVGWQVASPNCLNDTMVTAITPITSTSATLTLSGNSTVSQAAGTVTDTSTALGQEAYPTPADLSYFIPNTGWDRNFRWQLLGPVTAQEWQVLKSGISPVGPRLRYRLMDGQIFINPAPYVPPGQQGAISDLIVIEYCSRYWAGPTGTTVSNPTQNTFLADTDVCIAFPEDLITRSLKWRMLKSLGMAYAEEFGEYQTALERTSGRQTMARNLPLNARSTGIRLLNSQNVPDTNFGS